MLWLPSLEMGQALLLSSFFHGARQALAVSFFGPDSPGVKGLHVPCALCPALCGCWALNAGPYACSEFLTH